MIQNFLPLLGDIALAACGDEVARQLAEAALPGLEERGWKLRGSAEQIWAGERDAAALTEGLDDEDTALIRQALRLVEGGPEMIFVAQSIALAQDRRNAEQLTDRALANDNAEQRAELARQFEEAAGQAEQQPIRPLQELALHLRGLAARLKGA